MEQANEKTIISRLNPFLRRAIYQAFDGQCFYTGRDVSFEEMHIDHINPVVNGGSDCIENYVLSCQKINSKKQGLIYKKMISVALETNKALFAPSVISIYNELLLNEEILKNNLIEIRHYCKKNKIDNNGTTMTNFIAQCKRKIVCTRIKPYAKKKVKLYFDKKDLDRMKEVFFA